MIDGGGDNPKNLLAGFKRKLGGYSFSHAMERIAVAQICESEGFQGFQQSALDTLSDVAVQYILNLAKISHMNANSAGRTECNVFDILQGLEDLGSVVGFSGASDINHCMGNSGIVRGIVQYVSEAKEIPFAYSIPRFPVIKDRKMDPSFLQTGEQPPGDHIPMWLPKFPDPCTYIHLQAQNQQAKDPCANKFEHAINPKNLEESSASKDSKRHILVDPGGTSSTNNQRECNPFLAAPKLSEEQEMSPLNLSAQTSNLDVVGIYAGKNNFSLLETFAPVIEPVKSGLSDTAVEGQGIVVLNQRPAVQFQIGVRRKLFGAGMDFSFQNKSVENISQWLGKENEKDDKKRRAEKILKESIENPQELTQL